MDTNSIALFINALAHQKAAAPSSNLVLILATLAPLLAAVAAWFAKKTSVSVDLIHTAVNSERSATVEEIKSLKAEVLKLSEKLAFKEGRAENDAQELLTAAVVAASKKVNDGANQPNGNNP